MEPITIKLKSPIHHGGDVVSELVISRELEAGDMRDYPTDPNQQNFGQILDIIGKLAAQPPAVMNKIKPVDLTQITEVFQRFF